MERSKLLLFSSYAEPGPGSTIVVPVKADQEAINSAVLFGGIAQGLLVTTMMIPVVPAPALRVR